MTSAMTPGEFPETVQKDVLRERDLGLIKKLATAKRRRLTYCGLSGINVTDVLKWQEALDRVVIVERPPEDDAQRIKFKTSVLLKLSSLLNGRINLVFQDIWEYLCSSEYTNSKIVPDVLNLDFCGGLINEVAMEYPKQRVAFARVFERAAKEHGDFLLLLTLMPRDRGRETYKRYLQGTFNALQAQAESPDRDMFLRQLAANLRFHEKTNLSLFKACLPILLEEIGRSHNYHVKSTYIRLYTKMIHFAFECTFVSGELGLPPLDANALIRHLNQPMRKLLENGQERQDWPPQIGPP